MKKGIFSLVFLFVFLFAQSQTQSQVISQNKEKSINFKKLHPSKNLKIYDMRNIYSPIKIKSQGFQYFGIGR